MSTTKAEPSSYPTRWSEFIGQKVATEQIQVAMKSAKMRHAPADHLLLAHSDPGVGKTALARLAAKTMGTQVVEVSGRISVGEARLLMSNMADGDILFWDEIHQAVEGGNRYIEWMLPLLTDWLLIGPFGREETPHITVIAATTEIHKLPPAIVSRFVRPPLVGYSLEDSAKIAKLMGRKFLVNEGCPQLSKRDALSVAECANNNPRAISRLLVNLRDLTVTSRAANHDGRNYDLSAMFTHAGLTPDGLCYSAQSYLALLLSVNGEIGEAALRSHLQEPSLISIERVLLDKGYILKTRTGRTLTRGGLSRAKELAA